MLQKIRPVLIGFFLTMLLVISGSYTAYATTCSDGSYSSSSGSGTCSHHGGIAGGSSSTPYVPPPTLNNNYQTTLCADGTYSDSSGSGTCSHHGGIAGNNTDDDPWTGANDPSQGGNYNSKVENLPDTSFREDSGKVPTSEKTSPNPFLSSIFGGFLFAFFTPLGYFAGALIGIGGPEGKHGFLIHLTGALLCGLVIGLLSVSFW